MAKILSIVWYKVLPAKYGGQKGIANFNKYLGRQEELVCLCSKNNEPAGQLSYKLIPELPINKWQFINPFTWQKIISTVKKEKPSHIILEHPYHGIAGWLAKRKTGAKLAVHSHNIEYQRFRQSGKWWWPLLYRYEKWVHRRADLNLFKTEADLEQAVVSFKLKPDKCTVLPYGIDPEEIKPSKDTARKLIIERHGLKTGNKILIFAGTLDYKPNADAAENIYKEIAPMLAAQNFAGKIIICGRNYEKNYEYLKQLSHPLVIQAGEVNDIENYFAAADLFINPVMSGGGVQTKNIDAASFHLPVVDFSMSEELAKKGTTINKLFSARLGDFTGFTEKIMAALNKTPGQVNNLPSQSWANIASALAEWLIQS
jgi:glycosyltransferase involved in cell wall biosynthesis